MILHSQVDGGASVGESLRDVVQSEAEAITDWVERWQDGERQMRRSGTWWLNWRCTMETGDERGGLSVGVRVNEESISEFFSPLNLLLFMSFVNACIHNFSNLIHRLVLLVWIDEYIWNCVFV
ncbi:hypothetical protein RYX36_012238 [Vicia faba]